MKLYCTVCTKQQPVLIDNCVDARTNEPYQDIVCEECGLVIASGTGIEQPVSQELYKERGAQQAEQEPVTLPCCGYHDASAIMWNKFNGVVLCHNCGQLYAAPVRTKDLTDDEIFNLNECESSADIAFARAVIAAYKEKNRG